MHVARERPGCAEHVKECRAGRTATERHVRNNILADIDELAGPFPRRIAGLMTSGQWAMLVVVVEVDFREVLATNNGHILARTFSIVPSRVLTLFDGRKQRVS